MIPGEDITEFTVLNINKAIENADLPDAGTGFDIGSAPPRGELLRYLHKQEIRPIRQQPLFSGLEKRYGVCLTLQTRGEAL